MNKKRATQAANPPTFLPLIIIAAGVLLIIGVLVWQGLASRAAAPSSAAVSEDIPYPDVQRLAVAEAKTAYDQQTALFVDVRDAELYAEGHIPGAINIPSDTLENRLNELDANQWIITYCT